MVDVARVAVVGNVSGGSVAFVVGEGKLAKGWSGELGGGVVYERRSKGIQLSRPRRIGCCIVVSGGIIDAQTARAAMGE